MISNSIQIKKGLFFLPFFSGLLLGIGFIFPTLRIFGWIAFLPLLFFLDLKNISSKKVFLAGFLTGFIFLGQVMAWAFSTWPLSWLGIESKTLGLFLIFLTWLIFVGFLSLFIGLFTLSYWKLKKGGWPDLLLVPSLWIIFEYLRVWAFGIFFAGEESLLGPHWTVGNLAYSLAQNPSFRYTASIGGIYLASFLIVLINVLFFLLVRKAIEAKLPFNRIVYFLIILGIVGLISATYLVSFSRSSSEENQILKVAILQTKIPSSLRHTEETIKGRFQIQANLIKKVYQHSPKSEIIVFPEGSNFLKQKGSKENLATFFGEKDILIIDSGREKGKFVGTFYNLRKGILAKYEKILLVPVGDYLPSIIKWPAQIINKKWIEELKNRRNYKKGKEIVILSDGKFFQGGVLFCSEVLSSSLHRQFTQQGAQVFFNLGSLAFSRGSKILDSQTQAMLQFRAAENGRYLVRSTNYGSSYIINEKGEIIKKTPNFENQVLFGEVKPLSQKTFYTKFGDWILILANLVVLTFLFMVNSKIGTK